MSNYRAFAVVTAALRNRLSTLLGAVLPGATVTTLRPDSSASPLPNLGVNIFMYQITPNAALRNADLPTRRPDGSLIRLPAAAIDLHYLISFYGNDLNFETQILLGSVVANLHADPSLSRTDIQQVFSASALGSAPGGGQGDQTINELKMPNQPALLDPSGLTEAVDLVRFTPTELSLEELSKLWSVFLDTPYVLSIIYQAGPVVIEDSSGALTAAALPVMLPARVQALASVPPSIEQVFPATGPGQPIVATSTLSISGSLVAGVATTVLIDGMAATALTTPQTPTAGQPAITGVPLATTLLSGAHSIQLVQQAPTGLTIRPVTPIVSNIAGFVLQPIITSMTVATADTVTRALTVNVSPPVAAHQTVRLLLNLLTPATGTSTSGSGAYQLIGAPPQADGATSFVFSTKGQPGGDLPSGTYLGRIQIDGVDSPVTFVPPPTSGTATGATGFTAPTVVLT